MYLPGKSNVAADALSRHPQSEPDTPGNLIDAITEVSVTGILASVDTLHDYQSVTWDRVQTESHKDPVLSDLAELAATGFPEHKQSLPPKLQPYWDVRHELSRVGDGVVLGSRAVIPASLRTEVLQGLHAAHQGVAGMKARARYSVYWPGISAAIVNHRNTWRRCDIIAPSQSSESLDTDSFIRALLQHRNTPLQEIGHLPAELFYGRPLCDHFPTSHPHPPPHLWIWPTFALNGWQWPVIVS